MEFVIKVKGLRL